jgi:hypothetical protein
MNRHYNELIKGMLFKSCYYVVYAILIALIIIKFIAYVYG